MRRLLRRFSSFFLVALICAILLPSCDRASATDWQQSLLDRGYVSVPLKLSPGPWALILEANLAGKEDALLLLDIGDPYVEVDAELGNQLPTASDQTSISVQGAGGAQQSERTVTLPSLKAGSFTANNIQALVLPDSQTGTAGYHQGVAGLSLLMPHNAIIDVGGKRIYLQPEGDAPEQQTLAQFGRTMAQAGFAGIELTPTPDGPFTIPVEIDGNAALPFLIDTGGPYTFLSEELAQALQLAIDRNLPIIGGGAGNQAIAFYRTLLANKTFRVGPLNWLPVELKVFDMKTTGLDQVLGTRIHGSVGVDWMMAHNAVIDLAGKRLFGKY
ncbi:MAG: aspartyl protease family protein [Cyanobacteria bacterium P01_H01_bin.121]